MVQGGSRSDGMLGWFGGLLPLRRGSKGEGDGKNQACDGKNAGEYGDDEDAQYEQNMKEFLGQLQRPDNKSIK